MIKQQGFTLIEVMLASSLLAIVIGVSSAFWYYVRQNYEFGYTQYQLSEKAMQTSRLIANEVRQAQEAMNGAYPLATLDDNQLTYYADADSDGLIERRRYFVEGDKLKRGVIIPSGNPPDYIIANERITTLVDQLDTNGLQLFTYYNGNWPGDVTNNPLSYWTRPLETRLIKITIPIVIKDSGGDQRFSSESVVQIRNLKNNL